MSSEIRMIKENLNRIEHTMHQAAACCGRDPQSIKLLAVSKKISEKKIKMAIEAGVTMLGENYVQEAKSKIEALSSYTVEWHFIGHLQTNKAGQAVTLFELIHTVDSLKLALALDKHANKMKKRQQILIQVNISGEQTKSGINPKETLNLIMQVAHLENISVKGLMTMPPFSDDPEHSRPYFKTLSDLSHRIKQEALHHVEMRELSMGMTGDYSVAIEEGATLVRIGTALFGKRK